MVLCPFCVVFGAQASGPRPNCGPNVSAVVSRRGLCTGSVLSSESSARYVVGLGDGYGDKGTLGEDTEAFGLRQREEEGH